MDEKTKDPTVEEKLRLLVGKDAWRTNDLGGKRKSVRMSDGPHGLNMVDEETGEHSYTVVMPSSAVLASTWSRDAAYRQGATIADECIEGGADLLLAPGVNIKRTPLCGRNFEYFSEDPLLAGELGAAYIQGVQDGGVGACLKHFCANNIESDRALMSSEVDERTLREIYCKPFEIALRAKPWAVMCSYNPINGVYSSEHPMLKTVLRDRLGFDGAVVSDWGAVHEPYKSVRAGVDIAMPGEESYYDALKKAYDDGLLTEKEIDACAARVSQLAVRAQKATKKVRFSRAERHDNARAVAAEGIVLLKNDGVLPLRSGKITVGGQFAFDPPLVGTGSATARTKYRQKPLHELLAERLPESKTYGAAVFSNPTTAQDRRVFFELLSYTDAAVLCVGTRDDGEATDRNALRLPRIQEDAILRAAQYTDKLIVCVYGGGAVDMRAWIDKAQAVIWVGYAGEGGNEALADILTGKVVPSGKLAETFPICLEDTPGGADTGDGFCIRYREGVFVGYRGYDAEKKDVLFPFGYGLSYAKFAYGDLQLEKKGETDYNVHFTVENTSDFAAEEVAQVYVRDPLSMVSRPPRELKGFCKVNVPAHGKVHCVVPLDFSAFAFYSPALGEYYAENGTFEIAVGSSSRDIVLRAEIEVKQPNDAVYTGLDSLTL